VQPLEFIKNKGAIWQVLYTATYLDIYPVYIYSIVSNTNFNYFYVHLRRQRQGKLKLDN